MLQAHYFGYESLMNCLTRHLHFFKLHSPSYACAILSDYVYQGGWFHGNITCDFSVRKFACAPKSSNNLTLTLIGDGSDLDVAYDPTLFRRVGKTLYLNQVVKQ
ncbi:hypothetical protein L0F63_004866 [Massospora cicadina]|nr:hypothetical protein L0F63_004866 [Massospora cicadina]